MFKFEPERINELKIESENFKFPIPVITIKPKIEKDSSVVFIFNTGLASTNSIVKYMNYFLYDDNWLVSYEKAGHGENQNKPTKWKKTARQELDAVVDWVKKQFPNKKIYLIGESWGSQINMLYYKQYHNKVNGTVNWNAPLGIVDTEKRSAKFMLEVVVKHVLCFLFNKTFIVSNVQGDNSTVTSNPLLSRILSFQGNIKNNTKATINVYMHMKPTYRFLKKYGKNPDYNFLYIQSGQDKLAKKKIIDKLENKYCDDKHLVRFISGKHILSFEPNESKALYTLIQNFIKK